MTLNDALRKRRSIRQFSSAILSYEQMMQLMFAGQGVTNDMGYRTAPSAGALYPLMLYAVTATGMYQYIPMSNTLRPIGNADLRRELSQTVFQQSMVAQAPASIIIAGAVARTAQKYGAKAERYVTMEVGAVAQNILLQATAMNLGAVLVGAFNDDEVRAFMKFDKETYPYAIIPVGYPTASDQ